MNKWIEERQGKKIEDAMKSAVQTYSRIEKEGRILRSLQTILSEEDVDLEAMVIGGGFNVYSGNREVQIYTWRDDDKAKEATAGFLIAMVEAFGDGERTKSGNEIKYIWKAAMEGMDIAFEVPPATSGCEPAQAATTRTEYKIKCTEEVEVAD